jgi:hypothetical protein
MKKKLDMHRVGRDFFYEEMKRERGEHNDNENDATRIHIEIVNATPQLTACKGMLMILVDPDQLSWEQAQTLAIEDVTAIRSLRKTIEDNLVPIGVGSIVDWRAAIASAVDEFSRVPVKYTLMRDPNDEDGLKNMVRAIQGMVTGQSLADIKKQYEEDEQRDAKKKKEEQVEPDKEKK